MHWKTESERSLLEELKQKMPDTSTTALRECLEQGRILVNGEVEKRGSKILTVGMSLEFLPKRKYLRADVVVLYEDEDLILVEKPSGLLTVAKENGVEESLHTVLKRRFHRPMITPVHRLDRDASGLILFAYTELAIDVLQEQFKDHSIDRNYVGIVRGRPPEEKGSWKSYLLEREDFTVITVPPHQGRYACTHYELLQAGEEKSLLAFRLETGRKHQIRVHCAEAGCPLVGDARYGEVQIKKPGVKRKKERLYLHATHLSFTHPRTGKRLKFHSPAPKNFTV